jgi:hypothetical protein
MRKKLILVVGLCAASFLSFSPARAHVRSLQSLTPEETEALAASQQRLVIFDRELQSLDARLARRQVSRRQYAYEQHDLIVLISGEAAIQNGILRHSEPLISEGTREVLENIARCTVLVPAYALAFVAHGLAGSSYTFSP